MAYEYTDKADLLYTLTQIKSKLDGYLADYVKKVEGKDLSTNDLTDAMVTAIGTIANKANLASPELTGIPTAPTATEGTSTTQIATTNFVSVAIAKALSDVTGIQFKKVDALPETGESGVIYLVAKTTSSTSDIYTEYYWTGSEFEIMGSTSVDLSDYVKSSDLTAIKTTDIDAMFDTW